LDFRRVSQVALQRQQQTQTENRKQFAMSDWFNLSSGPTVTLLGFVLWLAHKLMRRRTGKDRRPARGLYLAWLRWGDLAALLAILAGLALMWSSQTAP
jgi:hypothetical protein